MQRFTGAIAFALALACSATAFAQTPSTGRDYSDLWNNTSESGWGANVIQQDTILFITLFVYGADGRPTWYVASNVGHVSSAGGSDTYSGDLLATTGSPFSANPYNASAFTFTSVGNITFTGMADGSATITYTVNGTQVSKRVTRQTWRANTIASTGYYGATNYVRSGCSTPALNGQQNDEASYTLTVTSTTFRLVEDNGTNNSGVRLICNWVGSYTQAGRLGAVTGTTTCEDNVPAAFTITDLQINARSFSLSFTAQEPAPGNCRAVGSIVGVRR